MKDMFSLKILSEDDIKKIHLESLKILQNIGIKVNHRVLLEIFKDNGACIDFNNKIVKIPKSLVNKCIKKAVKKQNDYYGKYGEKNDKTYQLKGWMSESNLSYLFDYDSQSKRKGKIQDMLYAIILGNNLENIERISCFIIKEDNKNEYYTILNYYLLYLFSKKRFFMGALNSLKAAKCIIEMAKVVADDEMQLINGKLVEFELEAISNLEFSKEHIDIAFEFAKNNMKILPGGWFWMGYHTPYTYASAIAVSNANILAAMIIVMLINPNNLFFDFVFGTQSISRYDNTFPLFGSPNQVFFSIAGKQLAKFYGFKKCIANSGLTDSSGYDYQSGFERGVTAALSIAGGVDQIGLQGIVGADRGVSFEELISDNEMLIILILFSEKK